MVWDDLNMVWETEAAGVSRKRHSIHTQGPTADPGRGDSGRTSTQS